jgi:hypothetical protein
VAGELITRDGQLEFNGLLMGAGTPYRFIRLEGWHESAYDSGSQARPGAHGAWPGELLAGTRSVIFTHGVRGDNVEHALSRLAMATRASDVELPLVAQFGGVKRLAWARCVRRSAPVDQAHAVGFVPLAALQWEATDPRIYSLETLTASTGLPRPGSGFDYPLTYPIDYGDAGNPGSLQATNAGDADSPPTLTLTGAAAQPVVINRTTGARLEFDLTLADTDELTIDVREGTVLLNGVNRLYALTADSDDPGDFLLAPAPGVNDIDFRASAPSDTALLTVSWQHASM